MENINDIIFLSGQGNHRLGRGILKELGEIYGKTLKYSHINYGKHIEKELNNKIVDYKNINGKIIVYNQSIYSPDLLYETLDTTWACTHQYNARYVIGLFHFFINRRQDPIMDESEKREPWSKKIPRPEEIQRLRQTIHLLSVCGVNEMLVATPHSSAMKNACIEYGVNFHEIDPSPLFAGTVETFIQGEDKSLVRVYSPDIGSISRAVNLARIIDCPVLFNLKNRALNHETSMVHAEKEEIEKFEKELREYHNFENIFYATPETVVDKIIIMVEDEIASGGTANTTGQLIKKCGAKLLLFFATHPVLTCLWREKLFYNNPFDKVIMTDSIPRGYENQTGGMIFDVSLAKPFASTLFKIIKTL